MTRRIIRNNATLLDEYDNLSPGDIVFGRIRIKPGEEHILLDLVARQVTIFPSAVAQLCSRSKIFQTRILGKYMVPGTVAIYNLHDILTLVSEYGRHDVGQVVCKLDRANGGQGVLLFSSVEDVYNNAVLGVLQYPFVIQPLIKDCQDVRAVVLGEHVNAYTRHNPNNFRHNLHCGGNNSPYELTSEQLQLCRKVMNRASFPYACVDLLLDSSGNTWLSEINLRGGLSGSALSQQNYLDAVEHIHSQMLSDFMKRTGGEGELE
jgi:ribosomal protein S6--L-glutamate ligase